VANRLLPTWEFYFQLKDTSAYIKQDTINLKYIADLQKKLKTPLDKTLARFDSVLEED
jgi:hypothetical protein